VLTGLPVYPYRPGDGSPQGDEKGNAVQGRGCPRNCQRRAGCHHATGATWEGDGRHRPASQDTCHHGRGIPPRPGRQRSRAGRGALVCMARVLSGWRMGRSGSGVGRQASWAGRNSGHLLPYAEGIGPCSPVFIGGQAVAAELEVVVDAGVGGQESLGMAR